MTDRPPFADGAAQDLLLEDEEDPDFPLQYASIHGHVVGFRRGGSGPALLFLHGIAGSSLTWIPVMSRLQNDFTVLAPDFVGHGHSAKPPGDYSLGNLASWTRDLLSVLGIERVTLVGQSYGGGVALQFAYQFPERIERLVLVDSGGLGQDVSWVLRLLAIPGADLVMPILFPSFVRNLGDQVARFARRVGMQNASVLEGWRAYRSLIDPETRRAFVRTTRSVIEPGGQAVGANERLYLTERIPMLVVWGEHDRIIPVSHAYATQEALPHARLEIIAGAGHFPQSEDPDKLADLVHDFVATTEPYAHSPAETRDRLRRGPAATGEHPPPTRTKTTTRPKGDSESRVG